MLWHLSADGHEWADTALATDYMEKSFADFPRSYPDLQDPDDFDGGGLFAGRDSSGTMPWRMAGSFRDYGEGTVAVKNWADPANKKPITFLDSYRDFVNHTGLIVYSNFAGV